MKGHKYYVFNRDICYGSRLCEICENSVMMAKSSDKALKNDKTDVPTNPHDIVEYNSCDSNNKSCMFSE